jgi:hypothetical protein
MEVQKNISFRLKNMELLQSNLSAVNVSISSETLFKFNINIEHLINLNENIIAIKPIVEIFIEEHNKKTILGGLSASLVFEFENLPSFVKDNEVKLPTDIINSINSISISTIRGIMFSTFKGTHLHNAFLPIIDPKLFNLNK